MDIGLEEMQLRDWLLLLSLEPLSHLMWLLLLTSLWLNLHAEPESASSELSLLLSQTFKAECMEEFWQRDSTGGIILDGVWANNQMPGHSSFTLPDERSVPIWSGEGPVTDRQMIIERMSISGAKARLRISGYGGVQVKARLEYQGGIWQLVRISVRQQVKTATGKLGKRYCYDF